MMRKIAIVSSLVVFVLPYLAAAQSADDIQKQIDAHNAQIAALDKEIAQYEAELNTVSSKKQTLQNALSQLDISIKKTTASIKVTQTQISSTELQIKQLSGTIADTQESIDVENAGLGESLRRLSENDARPLAILMLSADGLTGAWDDVQALNALQFAVHSHVVALGQEKTTLTNKKATAEEKRAELLAQQKKLQTQQGSLNAQKKAQSDLLAQTKSQESAYQKLIVQKKAQEADLEAALSDLKAKYNIAVNPDQITPAGQGILRWPVDNVRITQYFGNTAFARSGAYSGKGHNGIDFAAPIGTPLKAALSGTVVGTGNTDTVRGCYSFGKWVMVKHANGLSTMYAHLSQINVAQGEPVSTGDLLGYSGETGYATGPHLHFGVYVTSATQILTLGQATNAKTPCANAVMPVAPLAAYLNPADYLPSI